MATTLRTQSPARPAESFDSLNPATSEVIATFGVFSEDDVAQTVERFGRLDIVIHNAAVYPVIPIEALSDEDLDRTLAVNLKAGFWLIQESLAHLRKQGGGRILFTSSVTGPNVAMPGTAHYAASKGGMNGLIRTAALEYARQIAYTLSSTIGYSIPNRAAASATRDPSRAKENSGACTPTTTSPTCAYLLFHATTYGSVRMQLTQV